MVFSFKKFLEFSKGLLFPKTNIAGLEIKDTVLRIAQFQDGLLKKAAVTLEPGVIGGGRVKDKARLIAGLKRLQAEFAGSKEKVLAILSVPSANVYTQVFNTPLLSGQSLEEAANLNLKSISPIDLGAGYADWQEIGLQEKDGKLEVLAAFADRAAIDDYQQCLESAGFAAVAVEFPALAISRAIQALAVGIDIEKPQVVFNVASDGIDFMVLRRGNLYFHYFSPWKLIPADGELSSEIPFSEFKDTVIREIKKVVTFYGSHWEGRLGRLILITQALNAEISNFIKENFQFEVADLKLEGLPNLEAGWFGVIGSALRGKIPRSEDKLISLTAVGTEKEYWYSQIQFFIKIWRNVFIATLGFLVLLFILADSVIYQTSVNLGKQLRVVVREPGGAEVAELQAKARQFNQLVDKASVAKEQSVGRSPLFSKIIVLAGRGISLERILMDSQQASALLSGRADNEAAALAFKNALIKEGFRGVTLPLSNIVANLDKSVSFTITFKL
ncbi:MAG: pilus assembly protein PilM [Candidatus Harrisonbacteria bacterium]|nr:pilus assembly protein PilM [Candidatus Harrisonbacteria bacterium]